VLTRIPCLPCFFNLVGDVLTRMLAKAYEKGLISWLLGDFREGGITTLQYADDTLLFSSCEDQHLSNLWKVLMIFERVSEMRVNFHKSECTPLNVEEGRAHETAHILSCIAHILSCPLGKLPFKYLGVPLYFEKLKREDLHPVLDKLIKRISNWRGRLLAYSGKLVLIKSCL
jgi:hypothetical protein